MKIRKATSKDFEIICNFFDTVDDFETTLNPILSTSKEQRLAVREMVKKNLRDPNIRIFLSEMDGKAVGTITARYKADVRPRFAKRKMGILEYVFVLEKFRKKGIASALVSAAKKWLRRKGVDWFECYLLVDNIGSFNTFKKAKFKPYAYIMHCYE